MNLGVLHWNHINIFVISTFSICFWVLGGLSGYFYINMSAAVMHLTGATGRGMVLPERLQGYRWNISTVGSQWAGVSVWQHHKSTVGKSAAAGWRRRKRRVFKPKFWMANSLRSRLWHCKCSDSWRSCEYFCSTCILYSLLLYLLDTYDVNAHLCSLFRNYPPVVSAHYCEALSRFIDPGSDIFTGVLGSNQGREKWTKFNTFHGTQVRFTLRSTCPYLPSPWYDFDSVKTLNLAYELVMQWDKRIR